MHGSLKGSRGDIASIHLFWILCILFPFAIASPIPNVLQNIGSEEHSHERKDANAHDLHAHANHGHGEMKASIIPPSVDQQKYFDVSLFSKTVPQNESTYLCSLNLVKIKSDYHIIGFIPVVRNPKLVHHMIAYMCKSPPFRTSTFGCVSPPNECSHMLFGWSHGSDGEFLPDDVGIAPLNKGSQYIVLQTHYGKPTNQTMQDSSGIRVFYTDKLRPQRAGILAVGLNSMGIRIPPRMSSVEMSGICPSECLRLGGEAPITIIQSYFHMHAHGKSMSSSIFRSGGQTDILGQVANFSPHSNTIVKANRTTIYATDSIVTRCIYDTSTRARVVKGGMHTDDEMCLNFITYYPEKEIYSKSLCGVLSAKKKTGSLTFDCFGQAMSVPSVRQLKIAQSHPSQLQEIIRKETENAQRACGSSACEGR